jgi:hypothetical protein
MQADSPKAPIPWNNPDFRFNIALAIEHLENGSNGAIPLPLTQAETMKASGARLTRLPSG